MYIFCLYFRNVTYYLYLTLLFLSSLLTVNFSKAQQTDSTYNNIKSTIIEIPPENIKNIPIIGYKLVFQIHQGSLLNFFNDNTKELIRYLSEVGIKPKNIVIIYLNYQGNVNNKLDVPNYKDFKLDPNINFNKYTTDEQIVFNLTNLIKSYSLPFLTSKRKVIIGTLVDNTTIFKGNLHLKVVPFNFSHTKAINLFRLDGNNPSNSYQDESSNTTYTYEEVVKYRSSMISYMNLGYFKINSFIGMMEYRDIINNGYTFFALPGIQSDFLYPKNK